MTTPLKHDAAGFLAGTEAPPASDRGTEVLEGIESDTAAILGELQAPPCPALADRLASAIAQLQAESPANDPTHETSAPRKAKKTAANAYDVPTEEKRAAGRRMREARELAGMTLTEAAEVLGYSQPVQLSLMETGQRQITLRVVIACATLYGTTTHYLCGLATEVERDPVVAAHRGIVSTLSAELRRTLRLTTNAAVAAVRSLAPTERRLEALARAGVEAAGSFDRFRQHNPRFDDMRGGTRLARELSALALQAEMELADVQRSLRRKRARLADGLVEQPVLAALGLKRALQHQPTLPPEDEDDEQQVAG